MYMCGSDPHFAIRLPEGALFCYTFQGRHNTTFNLLGNNDLQMNAYFVPDATDYDNTWLGSIGVAVIRDGEKTTTLEFTAADQLVRIGEREFSSMQRPSRSYPSKVLSNHTQRYPRVEVEFIDSKLSFTIGFTKNSHLISTGAALEYHQKDPQELLVGLIYHAHVAIAFLYAIKLSLLQYSFPCRPVLP